MKFRCSYNSFDNPKKEKKATWLLGNFYVDLLLFLKIQVIIKCCEKYVGLSVLGIFKVSYWTSTPNTWCWELIHNYYG